MQWSYQFHGSIRIKYVHIYRKYLTSSKYTHLLIFVILLFSFFHLLKAEWLPNCIWDVMTFSKLLWCVQSAPYIASFITECSAALQSFRLFKLVSPMTIWTSWIVAFHCWAQHKDLASTCYYNVFQSPISFIHSFIHATNIYCPLCVIYWEYSNKE